LSSSKDAKHLLRQITADLGAKEKLTHSLSAEIVEEEQYLYLKQTNLADIQRCLTELVSGMLAKNESKDKITKDIILKN
jgi:hypothetical protein